MNDDFINFLEEDHGAQLCEITSEVQGCNCTNLLNQERKVKSFKIVMNFIRLSGFQRLGYPKAFWWI